MTSGKRNLSHKYVKEERKTAGDICANCGSKENIEYHHIVPLFLGGRECISNMVALCRRCHLAAHHGRHMLEYRSNKSGGRKPKVPDEEAFKAFDLFVNAEIGNKKCKQLIRISEKSQVKSCSQFVKYMKLNNIESVRNNIDIAATNSELKDGYIVGEIRYKDGSTKALKFKDTGKNDVEYTHRKQQIKDSNTDKQ